MLFSKALKVVSRQTLNDALLLLLSDYTNSLGNGNLFYANFTNMTFQPFMSVFFDIIKTHKERAPSKPIDFNLI